MYGRYHKSQKTYTNDDEDYNELDAQRDEEIEKDEEYDKGKIEEFIFQDFSDMKLKPNHKDYCLYISRNMQLIEDPKKMKKNFKEKTIVNKKEPLNILVYLETDSPLYIPASEFLTAIAQPRSRPKHIHEYIITDISLYSALSVGLNIDNIIKTLDKLSKVIIDTSLIQTIKRSTEKYGKARLVLRKGIYEIESQSKEILAYLVNSTNLKQYLYNSGSNKNGTSFEEKELDNEMKENVQFGVDDEEDEESERISKRHVFSTQLSIKGSEISEVKHECIRADYPLLEEYDFRNDKTSSFLNIRLKPTTFIRPYQERALSKMFGNGRARSGVIVLPCGAGKTLVGVTATATMKKNTIVICNSNVSVRQWMNEYKKWCVVNPETIVEYSKNSKSLLPKCCVLVTTYYILSHHFSREEHNKSVETDPSKMEIWNSIKNTEWGLAILDEVHIAPAATFNKAINTLRIHTKLGLTATLVREDDGIENIHIDIGPRLYEANWMELTQKGYLATVRCLEVWCPMTSLFYSKYLDSKDSQRLQIPILNPVKFLTCKELIEYHERNGDKILVFCDNLTALKFYSSTIQRDSICGDTTDKERQKILSGFRTDPNKNTIFISKVGDTSIDLPEATVIIQISSHYGSRRQEAQRLGRILRPKIGSTFGFTAFFYSLVSCDTTEMYHAERRQRYLTAQGYSYKVVKNIINQSSIQTDLESELLSTALQITENRKEIVEQDEIRTKGNSAYLAGAKNRIYNTSTR